MKIPTSYLKKTVKKYVDELSARQAVPGGGSAAALAGALGGALNLMVINYTAGVEKENTGRKEMVILRTKQEEIVERLMSLVDEDCKVFSRLIKFKGRNKEPLYIKSAEVPLTICHLCYMSMEITALLLDVAKRSILSDVGCAAELLKGAFSSAEFNVLINLKYIKNSSYTSKVREELAEMEKGLACVSKEVAASVKDFMREKNG